MPKRVGKYEIHKTLGEGTFGKVKKAFSAEDGEWVAIKVLDKEKIQKQNMGEQVKKEISIMKLVRHPHVVQLKEVLASRTKIFIVLELVTGGELFDKIVAEGRFREKTARFYFQQLCVGTEYCHRQGVCHRDLKPENLLLDESGNLKISDFGLSSLYEQGADEDRATLLHTTCGTPNYVAPEVLADKGYDGAVADTWSIGVILYVFLAGFLPFDEPTMAALFRKIQRAEFSYPTWFTAEVKDLLGHILEVDPAKRWTIRQVMAHSWWKKDGPYADCSDVEATAAPANGPSSGSAERDGDAAGAGDGSKKRGGSSSKPGTPKDGGRKSRPASSSDETRGVVKNVEEPPEESGNDNGDDGDNKNGAGAAAEAGGGDKKKAAKVSGGGGSGGGAMPKRINAFDLINMCSGDAMSRMLQGKAGGEDGGDGGEGGTGKAARKTHMYASHKAPPEIMVIVKDRFEHMEGFLELSVYKNDTKLRAVFDFGRGHVHVKVSVKVASEEPLVCLIVFKRARGDLISFERNISDALDSLAEDLQAGLVVHGDETGEGSKKSSSDDK